jgi:fructokinase
MQADAPSSRTLNAHFRPQTQHVVVLGEVLWDLFEHSRRLGGAALNFGVHARRLGHGVSLISAVGADELGRQATETITALDLDTTLLQTTAQFPTGTARVLLTPDGGTIFTIDRPAAYDAIVISDAQIEALCRLAPAWFYYGTLFASATDGKAVLERLLSKLSARRFYDLNLRPGFDSPTLVNRLLERADVVKLNEDELHQVQDYTGLPSETEAFCREGTLRYGWKAVGVTLGSRGCAILADDRYVEAAGYPVEVVDTVGAGDAFAAAFLHGLSALWPVAEIAAFANRVGALVASRHGAIPDWTLEEAGRL